MSLSDAASWFDSGYALFSGKLHSWYCLLWFILRGKRCQYAQLLSHVQLFVTLWTVVCPIINDTDSNHLVKVVFAKFPWYKVAIFYFVISNLCRGTLRLRK